ncbi:hypothetical protein J6590_021394 [Homalodisca vitripennis]|nr:hypothetical protein J6590_021394 [Homalodisca vitripennis]
MEGCRNCIGLLPTPLPQTDLATSAQSKLVLKRPDRSDVLTNRGCPSHTNQRTVRCWLSRITRNDSPEANKELSVLSLLLWRSWSNSKSPRSEFSQDLTGCH